MSRSGKKIDDFRTSEFKLSSLFIRKTFNSIVIVVIMLYILKVIFQAMYLFAVKNIPSKIGCKV